MRVKGVRAKGVRVHEGCEDEWCEGVGVSSVIMQSHMHSHNHTNQGWVGLGQ